MLLLNSDGSIIYNFTEMFSKDPPLAVSVCHSSDIIVEIPSLYLELSSI